MKTYLILIVCLLAVTPEQESKTTTNDLDGYTLPEGYNLIDNTMYVTDRSGDTLLLQKHIRTYYTYQTLTKRQKLKCRDIITQRSAD